VISLYPEMFQWKAPPYEYEFEKIPFDIITGDPLIRKAMEGMDPLHEIKVLASNS